MVDPQTAPRAKETRGDAAGRSPTRKVAKNCDPQFWIGIPTNFGLRQSESGRHGHFRGRDGEVSITKILFLGGGVFTIGIAEAGAKKAGASQPARIKPTTNQKIPAHAAFKQYTQLLGPAPPNK